jgi:AcrR family transcriptional regulator
MTEHHTETERRDQILSAALRLFTSNGFERTTVEQIASEAGLSKGAVYWYFESKLKILFALADAYVEESIRMLDHLVYDHNLGPTALYKVHRDLFQHQTSRPDHCGLFGQLIGMAERYPEIKEHLIRYDRMWDDAAARLIDQAMAEGVFRKSNPLLISRAIGALYSGMTMRQQLDPSIDAVAVIETATKLFFEALIIKQPRSIRRKQ